MAEKEYTRLTRSKSRSVFGIVSTSRSSLWLAKDHLLCIDTTGYTETYKRFHYRDIQAVIIRKTESWKVLAAILGAIAGVFALIAVFGGGPIVAWIFGSLAGFFLLGAILDLTAGPSCTCHLRTAVQTEELPSLIRVRRARKTLNRLRPLLTQAQGWLGAEDLPARFREWMAAEAGTSVSAAAAPLNAAGAPDSPSQPVP
ncbi:MAG TPA: hypothetical protein VNZ64_21345 [Candidatus Acidoferrum sp.]|jgi:hypothetical protein|nr:hypothetical protein [Candidatus Acidoferrum sp.]